MQILINNLNTLHTAFSRNVESTPHQAGANMVSLFRVFLNLVNGDKTQAEFRQQWDYTLKFFKEKENDGFGINRLFRGAPFWSLSHEDYQTFQAITNMIEATNRWGVRDCKKYINFVKLTKHPITETGRGRLLSYYN